MKGGERSMRGNMAAVVGCGAFWRGMCHRLASLNEGAGKEQAKGLMGWGS